jgi:hypothetical protein
MKPDSRIKPLLIAMRTASRRNSSVYLVAIPHLLHRKQCSKETGTKKGEIQFFLLAPSQANTDVLGTALGAFAMRLTPLESERVARNLRVGTFVGNENMHPDPKPIGLIKAAWSNANARFAGHSIKQAGRSYLAETALRVRGGAMPCQALISIKLEGIKRGMGGSPKRPTRSAALSL